MHVLRIEPRAGESFARQLERMRADPDVEFAVPDERRFPHAVPNDPLYHGQWYLQNTEIAVDDILPKLQAITAARGGMEERIFVRGDRKVDYGTVMKVMGRLSGAGFHRVALVTEIEQGG